jgi:hypothetical protein
MPLSRKWKIYYTDGSTFDSTQGEPNDAPCKGVAIVVSQDGRCGRRFMHGHDWYRWLPEYDRWGECREFDVLREVAVHGTVIARCGEYQGESEFEKILISAHEDNFIAAITPKKPPHPAWSA